MDIAANNINAVWKQVMAGDSGAAFLRIPMADYSRYLSYSFASFFRRALKLALAFHVELRMAPGERVAILTEDPNDFSLIVHGLWLAQLSAVPISSDFSSKALMSLINSGKIQAVIYPSEASARVASLLAGPSPVKHWLVSGSGMEFSPISGIQRLEEVAVAAPNDISYLEDVEHLNSEALYLLVEKASKLYKEVSFSQAQLLSLSKAAVNLYPIAKPKQLVWTTLPLKSACSIVHTLLVPMFSRIQHLIRECEDANEFWAQMKSDNVSFALIDYPFLRALANRGKPGDWAKPNDFMLGVYNTTRISTELLEHCERLFNLSLFPYYCREEGGGFVTGFPAKCIEEAQDENKDPEIHTEQVPWRHGYSVPSAGYPIDGIDFLVVDESGDDVGPEVTGEVVVRIEHLQGDEETEVIEPLHRKDVFRTGDEGFYLSDDQQRKHLFITGRLDEMIEREDVRLNPALIDNTLYTLREVEFAMSVGFPNYYTGFEVGAFIVCKRGYRLSEEDLIRKCENILEWPECPKVIILGKRPDIDLYRFRSDLLPLFEEHFHMNYVQV